MIRTLAIRVYPNGDYSTPLSNTDTNAVRLMYATIVGGNVIVGGAVPGSEFGHSGNGVWERDVDTSLMDDNRTDYYYVQYRIKSGSPLAWGEWTGITGFDPFFFNTKVLSGYESVKPAITSLVPSPITVEENAMSIILTIPGTYATGGIIPPSNIYEIDTFFPGDIDGSAVSQYISLPDTITWVKGRSTDSKYIIHRVGNNLSMDCVVFYRYRVYNPTTMEYSSYSELSSSYGTYKLVMPSAQEIIDVGTLESMPGLVSGDVTEVDSWGSKDSISIRTPQLGRGNAVNVAVQFGGDKPEIADGKLSGFYGIEISTGQTYVIVPKPVSIVGSLKVYVARKRVGLSTSGDWMGISDEAFYEIAIDAPNRLNMINTETLNAITQHVISKAQTADGTGLEVRS